MSDSLIELEKKTSELEMWSEEKQKEMKTDIDYTSAIYIESYDAITNQLLQLNSNIKTYNDMIYYIEKAQQNGHIDIKTCLKEIRKLSKEEFLCRLHINKINNYIYAQSKNNNYNNYSSNSNDENEFKSQVSFYANNTSSNTGSNISLNSMMNTDNNNSAIYNSNGGRHNSGPPKPVRNPNHFK